MWSRTDTRRGPLPAWVQTMPHCTLLGAKFPVFMRHSARHPLNGIEAPLASDLPVRKAVPPRADTTGGTHTALAQPPKRPGESTPVEKTGKTRSPGRPHAPPAQQKTAADTRAHPHLPP